MTDTTLTPVDDSTHHSMPLQGAQLPRYAPGLAAGIAVGILSLVITNTTLGYRVAIFRRKKSH